MRHKDNAPLVLPMWSIKSLVSAIALGLASVPAYTDTPTTTNRKPIGDLEIYAAAKPGTASIFMMLDTSGSMTYYDRTCTGKKSDQKDYEIKLTVYERKKDETQKDGLYKDENSNTVLDLSKPYRSFTYLPYGCKDKEKPSTIATDRMTRLQMAVIELLADRVINTKDGSLKPTGSLPDDYSIGVGNYSYNGDGSRAVILTPTQELTAEQRSTLIETIIGLRATGGTPTAHALAEAGAYMMGTRTKDSGRTNNTWWSGFDYSNQSTRSGNSYISPLNDTECSGNGIYLLTDGEPNGSSTSKAKAIMNNSLSYSSTLSVNDCNGLSGDSSAAWGCMAEYAALLRNPANNSKKLPIKTATVGFGKDFAGLNGTRSIIINGKQKEIVDCESGNADKNANVRNLCRLGERRGDNEVKKFGDGGFYYTEESDDIAASIVDFASGLVQIINTAPSGTITVPDDPYQAADQMPYAYLPMLDPDINSAATIWRGNLKKYSLNQGTLFGKGDNNALYEDIAGNLNAATQDLWQEIGMTSEGKDANNNINAGGVYAQLKSPKSGLSSVRNVYIEDVFSNASSTPMLRKIGVNASGSATGFVDLADPINTDDLNKRRLLSFLGFDNIKNKKGVQTTLLTSGGQTTDDSLVSQITMLPPSQDIRILGGVVHSTPTVVSYSATLDDYGRITDDRDDYVLFGSMDGALHLVDAKEGKEEFAIIPKVMMQQQPTALVDGAIKDEVGTPYFGVDAPWLVKTDYKFDLDNKKVKVDDSSGKGMFAYGGLRMGGSALYGFDITKKNDPKVMFTITASGRNNATNQDFARLGQIWSKPAAAKVRLNPSAEPTDVIIFGGGYDMQYEDDSFAATSAAPAKGNAIFMVDALTGKLLWSASSNSNSSTVVPDMIHSITGEVTILDRNNDGLMDHLYVADLGGQVFRADFENARPAQGGRPAVSEFTNKRVSRILNASADIDKKYGYRFYTRPLVSFYRAEGGANNGKIFALVNVISGNRSAPLSKLRNDNKYANRLYGIIDTDVTRTDLYDAGFTATIKDLKENNLVDLNAEMVTKAGVNKQTVKNTMITGNKKGWYFPLTRFDGYNNVRHNQGMGDMAAINNILYATVYNPDKVYGTISSCAARIVGGSERQMYCLPYGICMDDTSVTGTGGFMPAGQGIHELTLGAYNAKNKDIKVLIGTTTITERIEQAKRSGYNQDSIKDGSNIKDLYPGESIRPTQLGGDGSAAEFLFNERYTLQPKAWYEQKVGE